MQFFQIEEEKQYSYKCLKINQFNAKIQKVFGKPAKKMYEKYRDMKLAIQLIEKAQKKQLEILDLQEEIVNEQNLIRAQTSSNFRPHHNHITNSYQNGRFSSFKKKRLGKPNSKTFCQDQGLQSIQAVQNDVIFLIMKQTNPVQSKILTSQTTFLGKWFGIRTIDYSIGEKVVKGYQASFRTTRKNQQADMDGVQVVPIIKNNNQKFQLVFIANFRPAAGGFCVQFPAGMLDDQNLQQNALRQLRQETGLKASKILKLPLAPIYCDPWKSNQSGMFYIAIVDGTSPEFRVKQDLDNQENIRVFTLPLDENLCKNLSTYAEQKGYFIHTKVWILCAGFNFSSLLAF